MAMQGGNQGRAPAADDPRKRILSNIEGWAGTFLEKMVHGPRLLEATGRLATALRVVAQQNPNILLCTPESIAQCVATCALTGLMPGGVQPRVYLIPRKQRRKDANGRWGDVHVLGWQIAYRGYEELAAREGWGVTSVLISHTDTWRPLDLDDEIAMVNGTPFVRGNMKSKSGALITLVTGEQMVLARDLDDPPQEWAEIRGVLLKCTQADGRVVYGWASRKHIEPRLRVSETFKSAVTKAAKIDEKLDLNDWQAKPSAAGLEKARKLPVDELLRFVEGPWSDWTAEMVQKTGVTALLSDNLVHLPDAMQWAVEADKRSAAGLSIDRDDDADDNGEIHGRGEATREPARAALAAPSQHVDVPMGTMGMDGLANALGGSAEEDTDWSGGAGAKSAEAKAE